jgi:hypothetical protein
MFIKSTDIECNNNYIAMDSNLEVFAGYDKGYPIWSIDINNAKNINNTSHIKTLRTWFPNKQIELIEV